MDVGVSVLQTGTISLRPSHVAQSADRPVLARRLRVLLDRRWTEPLPIYAFLIDHPDGPILFDTGESPHASERGWMPWWNPFFHRCERLHVGPGEGIGARLRERGIRPKDLQAVVLSHLHHDHADGLADLAGARVLVTAEHWKVFRHRIRATLEGAVPRHWPEGFAPELIRASGPPVGPWPRSYPITRDGAVVGVPTTGHVPGHLSVLVFARDATFLLAGDATYRQDLLDAGVTDGVNADPREAVASLATIRRYACDHEIVVLPAHEPGVPERLAARETYVPTRQPPPGVCGTNRGT